MAERHDASIQVVKDRGGRVCEAVSGPHVCYQDPDHLQSTARVAPHRCECGEAWGSGEEIDGE